MQKLSVDIAEDRLNRILKGIAKNNTGLAVELAEIFNTLLVALSEKEMDLDEMTWYYNDLRKGTIEYIKTTKRLNGILKKISDDRN
jgi:hypothetical protein